MRSPWKEAQLLQRHCRMIQSARIRAKARCRTLLETQFHNVAKAKIERGYLVGRKDFRRYEASAPAVGTFRKNGLNGIVERHRCDPKLPWRAAKQEVTLDLNKPRLSREAV